MHSMPIFRMSLTSLNLEVPGASTMNDETKRIDTRYIVHACGVHTCSVFGTSGVGVCAHMGDRSVRTPRLRVLIAGLATIGFNWSALSVCHDLYLGGSHREGPVT